MGGAWSQVTININGVDAVADRVDQIADAVGTATLHSIEEAFERGAEMMEQKLTPHLGSGADKRVVR